MVCSQRSEIQERGKKCAKVNSFLANEGFASLLLTKRVFDGHWLRCDGAHEIPFPSIKTKTKGLRLNSQRSAQKDNTALISVWSRIKDTLGKLLITFSVHTQAITHSRFVFPS